MKTDDTEDGLRNLFAGMRRRDEAAAPAFDRLTREPAPHGSAAWLRLAAVTALAALCVGLIARAPGRGGGEADMTSWAALSGWQAGTDTLLTMSQTPWKVRISTPTDGWIDSGSSMSETTQPTEKEML